MLPVDCRVQPGECYHLYTAFHEAQFADYQLPEMLRTRLEELCLQIKVKSNPLKITSLNVTIHLLSHNILSPANACSNQ